MTITPSVSVLIPTYNYAHFLPECIESVLAQTFTDFELIIVDDQSSDNTDEVVQPYLADPRVRYYKNEKNLGLVGNWNQCLHYAKGLYIKFLMADDLFVPTLLEKFVSVIEQHPSVSLITCYKKEFGIRQNTWQLPFSGFQTGQKIIEHTLLHYGWLGEPTTIMFKRADLKVGLFNQRFTWLPDWEMWLRLLNVGDCYIIPEPIALIRNHGGQVTKKVMKSYLNYFEEYQLFKDINNRNGYTIDTSALNMPALIKKKAAKCANAMYKELPQTFSKHSRKIAYKAGKIAFSENVVLSPFYNLFKKKEAVKKCLTNM
jgi:glycosyltransferase involved in cell wall biosynthesis